MLEIKSMTIADTKEVAAIEKEIFTIPWSENSFNDSCTNEDNVYIVAYVDGQVAGYCGMWTVLGEGNITNVAVAPQFRRMGVAEKLMTELEKRGQKKDVSVFFLEVRESNNAARHLYSKLGFKDIGMRKGFYEKPVENAIVMSKIYRI